MNQLFIYPFYTNRPNFAKGASRTGKNFGKVNYGIFGIFGIFGIINIIPYLCTLLNIYRPLTINH